MPRRSSDAGPVEPLAVSPAWILKRTPIKKTALYEALKRNEIAHSRIGRSIAIPMAEIRRLFGDSAH